MLTYKVVLFTLFILLVVLPVVVYTCCKMAIAGLHAGKEHVNKIKRNYGQS